MHEFHFRPGLLSVFSDTPGQRVALFGPFGTLPFRNDASVFSDERQRYIWAFEFWGTLEIGQHFVFATADREVVGKVVANDSIVVSDRTAMVVRDDEGNPVNLLTLVDAPLPVIFGSADPPLSRRPMAVVPEMSPHPIPWTREVMTRVPKVSVITCSYNRPQMLREAIESLREQTDQDFEHLICDDCSTDPAVNDVLVWAAEDPRVRVWRRPANMDRPSVLWNFLFDRARGRYFTVLDDDNRKLPRFIEVMAGRLDADPSLDFVTCGWEVQCKGERTPCHLNLSTTAAEIDERSTCDGGAALYRREAFERVGYFSEVLRTNEDWDLMRRAVSWCRVENLEECLATYRSHPENRMARAESLGNSIDVRRVHARRLQRDFGVRFIRPEPSRLTSSQRDVIGSLENAFAAIPWASHGDDVAMVVAPFQMESHEIVQEVQGCSSILSLHMEDPYALDANLERVRAMVATGLPVMVCTNDASTVLRYRSIVGDSVIVCPSLSADDTIEVPAVERDIDVLFCGYAYPSRKKFMERLWPLLSGLNVLLVGDGWESSPVRHICTQGLERTYALHRRAKAVVCLQRVHGDCADGPVEPRTVNRGYMEGYGGARVFLDMGRDQHALEPGDVVWYRDEGDLAVKLRDYVSRPRDPLANRFEERCASIYTYRTRLARILNCMRAPRFNVEIP